MIALTFIGAARLELPHTLDSAGNHRARQAVPTTGSSISTMPTATGWPRSPNGWSTRRPAPSTAARPPPPSGHLRPLPHRPARTVDTNDNVVVVERSLTVSLAFGGDLQLTVRSFDQQDRPAGARPHDGATNIPPTSPRSIWSSTKMAKVASYEEYFAFGGSAFIRRPRPSRRERQDLPLLRARNATTSRSLYLLRRALLRSMARPLDQRRSAGAPPTASTFYCYAGDNPVSYADPAARPRSRSTRAASAAAAMAHRSPTFGGVSLRPVFEAMMNNPGKTWLASSAVGSGPHLEHVGAGGGGGGGGGGAGGGGGVIAVRHPCDRACELSEDPRKGIAALHRHRPHATGQERADPGGGQILPRRRNPQFHGTRLPTPSSWARSSYSKPGQDQDGRGQEGARSRSGDQANQGDHPPICTMPIRSSASRNVIPFLLPPQITVHFEPDPDSVLKILG